MKKKLLALLLASSMALMNVAPAYGTDIFTDPDNVANEDVISVPEELDNNGEFNDTEDEFTSEQTDDDFFSDEKEMPSVQEGDTLVANAGQGITAGTSTYSSKSSFGRRKALSQLQGMGINSGSYSWNWAILNILLTIQMKQEIFTLLPGKFRLYMLPPAIPILMLPM